MDRSAIQRALTAVGELLSADGERAAVVVTGGATLNLLGILSRATTDVDVIAQAWRDEGGTVRLRPAEPFPPALTQAIRTAARDLDLDELWMNAAVGKQWNQGLPPHLLEGLHWRNFGGGLDVGLVGRQSLIALKLFAAIDQGPASVHQQDLFQLEATDQEIAAAREWVLTQDAGDQWPRLVDQAVEYAKRTR